MQVDTEQAHEKLISTRLAYVSVSRGRYIYMNDADKLDEEVGKRFPKPSAPGIEQRSGDR